MSFGPKPAATKAVTATNKPAPIARQPYTEKPLAQASFFSAGLAAVVATVKAHAIISTLSFLAVAVGVAYAADYYFESGYFNAAWAKIKDVCGYGDKDTAAKGETKKAEASNDNTAANTPAVLNAANQKPASNETNENVNTPESNLSFKM